MCRWQAGWEGVWEQLGCTGGLEGDMLPREKSAGKLKLLKSGGMLPQQGLGLLLAWHSGLLELPQPTRPGPGEALGC